MKSKIHVVLHVWVSCLLVAAPGNAQEYTLDAYKKAYDQKHQALLLQYGKDLDAGLLDLKKKGDLDNYLLVEAEKKRFDREKTVKEIYPSKVPQLSAAVSYGQALAQLQEQYIKALEEHIRKSLIANRIDEAKAAKAVKDEAAASLAGLRERLPAAVPSPVSTATSGQARPVTFLTGFFAQHAKDQVLYYTFDRRAGGTEADASKNKNDGRSMGVKNVQEGKVGSAALFDGGAARILLNHDASLEMGAGARTLGAWIKSNGSTGGYQALFYKGSNPGYAMRLASAPDRALEYFKGDGNTASAYTSSCVIRDSDWHHVAVVDQGNGTVEFYKDGLLVESFSRQSLNANTKEKAAVGGAPSGESKQGFNGMMDELFIFKRALTQEEMKALYDEQSKKGKK